MKVSGRAAGLACVLAVYGCSGRTSDTDPGLIDAHFIMGDASLTRAPDGGPRPPALDSGSDFVPCGPEVCGDGLDGNCDGRVDDGCFCVPGDVGACFRGSAEARGVGACRDGTMTCMDALEFGTWSDCSGDVRPAAEVCGADAVDEDCDGAVNEGCECADADPPIACGSDEGACVPGMQACEAGHLGECVGATGPVAETCNGVDDDCDGETDEGLARACGTDEGECVAGTETCVMGVWEACSGGREAGVETCNGLDDDCDGATDEDLVQGCGSDVGSCSSGMQTCAGGTWSECAGVLLPGVEDCNGLDDDCDGATDEDLTRGCGIDVGACSGGTATCFGGAWGACSGGIGPAVERCDGVVDDDCDGTVDDGCGCIAGAARACGTDVGACIAGSEICDAAGAWGACTGAVGAGTETCNAVDDDCDGSTDELLARPCGTDTGACAMGTERCAAGVWGSCSGGVTPVPERCDGLVDDDCDGVVDDGCDCATGATRACGTDVGACVAGRETCDTAGRWGTCTGAVGPAIETCNGVDDDCDGAIDETLARACGTDVGECVAGTQTCGAGIWGTCSGRGPVAESCNGLDDDCNGTIDDGCSCVTGATRGCGTDVGECVAGTQTCDALGRWGSCTGAVGPVAETCNNRDDDCDGATDETLSRGCGTDVGACVAGTQACSAGAWGTCTGSIGPAPERCDGSVDDDCDGIVDDGCACSLGMTRSCGTGTGECVAGTESCDITGTWGACTGAVGPVAETCNNRDDDCDGSTDEMLSRGCGTDVGACVAGTQACSAGAWGTCTGSVGPVTERCDGVLDDDCDGLTDEGCACTSGMTRPCGTDVGECVAGTETCSISGAWGTCSGSTGPRTEICNMRDDDCDGSTDEGGVCITTPPVAMCPAGLSAEVLSTVTLSSSGSDPDGGIVTYRWTVIARPTGSTSTPASPTSPTTTFFLDASGTYDVQFCVTDDEGDTACCTVRVISTPPGVLHVEVSWSTVYGDVDLHLLNVTRTPPDGWWTTDDCYYGNPTPDWTPAGVAANPTLDRDDTDGYGPENTTIDVSPASGSYNIGTHYFCQHSIGGTGVGDGPTVGTVRVYCMGALIATYTDIRLNRTDDWVNVARVDWPSCVGRSVGTTTTGTTLLPASFTAARHCEIPCTTTADCPTLHRCALVGGGGPPRNACILSR